MLCVCMRAHLTEVHLCAIYIGTSPGLLCSKFCLLCAFEHYEQCSWSKVTYILWSKSCPSLLQLCHIVHIASYSFIIFNDCISIVRLQPVVFYIMLCCSALIFYTLCLILCLWVNLCLILHQAGMITMSRIKNVILKVMIRMSTNWLIITFNWLHW